MSKSRKIGVMGGSFNPIHTGHAIIASHIVESERLDLLLMMVTPQNPFKVDATMADDIHRLRMTTLVTNRIERAETSAFEMNLPKPNYTINTLNELQAKFPNDELHLVIGADNWAAWERWKEPEVILRRYHVIVYPRAGFEIVIPNELSERVKAVDAPIVELSSTLVRQQRAQGKSIAFLVPDDVEQYITTHNLYNAV